MARWASILLLLPLAAGAQAPSAEGTTQSAAAQTALRLENSLLSLDLVSYTEMRDRARRAQQGVNDVLGRLDQALAGDSVSLGTLESLQNDLDAARAASRITEDRLSGQLERIQERLRRIGLLQGGQGTAAPRPADPITGRWRVAVSPQNATATFDLRLNGTVVSGTYQVVGGFGGSFRGTYTNGKLRMERIDANGGFDSVWEGTVTGSGRITGTYTSNQLATGQPNRGDWTAVREGGQ
jgi:hypothetical protein